MRWKQPGRGDRHCGESQEREHMKLLSEFDSGSGESLSFVLESTELAHMQSSGEILVQAKEDRSMWVQDLRIWWNS